MVTEERAVYHRERGWDRENILEELKEWSKHEGQEHSYAVAEAYHYAGLALHNSGDEDGAKIYYEKGILGIC